MKSKKTATGFLKFEFLMFCKNYVSAFFLLLFPSVMLVTFGSIYGNKPMDIYGGHGSIDMFVPSYSGMVIAVTGLMSIPLSVCDYREKGVFKRYYATPIKPAYVIYSQMIINTLMTILGMLIVVIVSKFFYHVKITENLLQCFLIFFLSMMAIFPIGFFIGGIAPNVKSVSAISYFIYFPMLFLTGSTIPYEILSPSVQHFAQFLPLSYTVSAMKSVWNGGSLGDNWSSLAMLCIYAVLFSVLGKITFKWNTK